MNPLIKFFIVVVIVAFTTTIAIFIKVWFAPWIVCKWHMFRLFFFLKKMSKEYDKNDKMKKELDAVAKLVIKSVLEDGVFDKDE